MFDWSVTVPLLINTLVVSVPEQLKILIQDKISDMDIRW